MSEHLEAVVERALISEHQGKERTFGVFAAYAPPGRKRKEAKLYIEPIAREQPFGAVVPHVHLHDLAASHDETVDVAVAFERRAVRPLAIQRAEIIDDGFAVSWHDVGRSIFFFTHL